jgi:hypothetical protein
MPYDSVFARDSMCCNWLTILNDRVLQGRDEVFKLLYLCNKLWRV